MLAHQDEERQRSIYERLRKDMRGAQGVPSPQEFNSQIAADRKRGYVFHHSTLDPGLAPQGQHVASLFVQHVAPHLPQGRSWADPQEKEAFADLVVETVTGHAPNFKAAVIARQVLSPLDLERRFGMVDGDIFHGALSLDQLYSARPQLGYANYRMPVPGLYLCGSGAHPGGGVTGAPGRNAAREIIRDLKGWRRWM